MEYSLLKLLPITSLKKSGFGFHHDEMWFYCIRDFNFLPAQGWKIHLSVLPNHLGSTIEKVGELASKFDFAFKVPVKWHTALKISYGSYGYLMQGKEVTIYPRSQEPASLFALCNALDQFLNDASFCDVVTDIQYKDGQVFLRYGSFGKNFRFDDRGNVVPQIINKEGKLIDDIKKIGQYKPEWINTPSFLNKESNESKSKTVYLPADITGIQLVRKRVGSTVFSGRYAGKEVIIKIAMKNRLFDETERSNVSRLLHESKIMQALPESFNHPKLYRTINSDGGSILIEQLIHGVPFNEIISNCTADNSKINLTAVFKKIAYQMRILSKSGIAFRDLSPNNILIDADQEPYFIDFEIADFAGRIDAFQGGTPGFILPSQIRTRLQRASILSDKFSFASLLFYASTKIVPIFEEEYYNTLNKLYTKMYTLINRLNLTKRNRFLANLAVKIMSNLSFSWTHIIDLLSSDNSIHTPVHGIQARISSGTLRKQILNMSHNYIDQQLHLISATNIYPVHNYSSFNQGPLSLIALMMRYDLAKRSHNYPGDIGNLFNLIYDQWKNEPAHVHNLINGDISLLLICEYLKNQALTSSSTLAQATSTSERLLFELSEANFDDYSIGMYYGLSGIGITLCLAYMQSSDTKFKQTVPNLLKKVYTNIWSRRYTHSKDVLAIDIGPKKPFPQNESTRDLEYGLAGVGIFFIQYYLITGQLSILASARAIYTSLRKSVQINKVGNLFWYETDATLIHKNGLSKGDLGILVFLQLFADSTREDKVTQFKDSLANQLLGDSAFLGSPDVNSGISGLILAESIVSANHPLNTQHNRLLLDLSTPYGRTLSWAYNNMYINNSHSFLYGETGIFYSLLVSINSQNTILDNPWKRN